VLDIEHEQMICALAPDRADQAFNIPILPGRAVRCGPVPDPCGFRELRFVRIGGVARQGSTAR
jgi:hypothetical protein